jgi:hypothetical protein
VGIGIGRDRRSTAVHDTLILALQCVGMGVDTAPNKKLGLAPPGTHKTAHWPDPPRRGETQLFAKQNPFSLQGKKAGFGSKKRRRIVQSKKIDCPATIVLNEAEYFFKADLKLPANSYVQILKEAERVFSGARSDVWMYHTIFMRLGRVHNHSTTEVRFSHTTTPFGRKTFLVLQFLSFFRHSRVRARWSIAE